MLSTNAALPRPALQQHSVTATVMDVGCETLKWRRNAEHRSRAAQACSTKQVITGNAPQTISVAHA